MDLCLYVTVMGTQLRQPRLLFIMVVHRRNLLLNADSVNNLHALKAYMRIL